MMSELFLILIIALVVFGPKQLQQIAYRVGRASRWIKQLQQMGEKNFQQLKNEWTYQENLARAQKVETQKTPHD